MSESKFYDIWPTLRHVSDMSKTFPTKMIVGGMIVVEWMRATEMVADPSYNSSIMETSCVSIRSATPDVTFEDRQYLPLLAC